MHPDLVTVIKEKPSHLSTYITNKRKYIRYKRNTDKQSLTSQQVNKLHQVFGHVNKDNPIPGSPSPEPAILTMLCVWI